MTTLNERIKKLRKELSLTQQEFADKLNIKRNTVATYETGKSNPSDAAVVLICKTFNVNEGWLRTGDGEMFIKQSQEDELSATVQRLITGESAEFKKRLINALSTLKEEHWLLLEQKLKEIVGMSEAVPAFAPSLDAERQGQTESSIESEARAEAEAQTERIYEQILAEKKAAAGMSSESSAQEVGGGTVKQA